MRLLALGLVFLLAGCASTDPDSGTGATMGTTATSTGNATSEPAPPVPAATDRIEPYEATGKTWTIACVSTPAGPQCHTLAEGSDLTMMFPDGWSVVAVELELTWTTGNERMGFGIVRDDNGTMVGDTTYYVEGTSPLTVSFDLQPLLGQRIGYHVGSFASAGAAGVQGNVSPGQEWDLAGTVVVRDG